MFSLTTTTRLNSSKVGGNLRLGASLLIGLAAFMAAAASATEPEDAQLVQESTVAETPAEDEAPSDEAATTSEGDAAAGGTFGVGDVVALGDYQLTVNGVVDPQEPVSEFLSPAEGMRWVSIDVTVENTSAEPAPFSSLLSFELQDADAFTYTQALTDVEPQAPDGEIPAGGKKRGFMVYEVPAEASGLTLLFTGDLLSTGTATIQLDS